MDFFSSSDSEDDEEDDDVDEDELSDESDSESLSDFEEPSDEDDELLLESESESDDELESLSESDDEDDDDEPSPSDFFFFFFFSNIVLVLATSSSLVLSSSSFIRLIISLVRDGRYVYLRFPVHWYVQWPFSRHRWHRTFSALGSLVSAETTPPAAHSLPFSLFHSPPADSQGLFPKEKFSLAHKVYCVFPFVDTTVFLQQYKSS